jgi:hypothetical protein
MQTLASLGLEVSSARTSYFHFCAINSILLRILHLVVLPRIYNNKSSPIVGKYLVVDYLVFWLGACDPWTQFLFVTVLDYFLRSGSL